MARKVRLGLVARLRVERLRWLRRKGGSKGRRVINRTGRSISWIGYQRWWTPMRWGTRTCRFLLFSRTRPANPPPERKLTKAKVYPAPKKIQDLTCNNAHHPKNYPSSKSYPSPILFSTHNPKPRPNPQSNATASSSTTKKPSANLYNDLIRIYNSSLINPNEISAAHHFGLQHPWNLRVSRFQEDVREGKTDPHLLWEEG